MKTIFRLLRNKRNQTGSAGEGGTLGLPGSNSPYPEFGIEKGGPFYDALVSSQVSELPFSRSPFPSSLRTQKIRKRVLKIMAVLGMRFCGTNTVLLSEQPP